MDTAKREPKVKGNQILDISRYIKKTYGPDAFERAIAAIKKECKYSIPQNIRGSSWVPEKLHMDLLETIEKMFGIGDYDVCFNAGKLSGGVGFKSIYNIFIEVFDIIFLLKHAPIIYRTIHSHGSINIVLDKSKKNLYRIRVSHVPFPTKGYCAYLRGYLHGLIRRHISLKNPLVEEEKCFLDGKPFCEFKCSWED
ncbi:MAG: hypothetical protein GY853_06310 [PVC group bacterium]|nr:hypothetical protein [PVC group bacterium]